jgi:hypothetical protein
MPIYPISFSIPESKIVDSVPVKTRFLAHIQPGLLHTYIYTNELDYYNGYRTAMFGLTKMKAGWDCMRHYEILANGCIPYFEDLEACPEQTMTHLPKELLLETNDFYNRIKHLGDNVIHDAEIMQKYMGYASQLLEYTRAQLTTRAMASYILSKITHKPVSRILFVSGSQYPDYMRCLSLIGFKQLKNIECHDFSRISHIYEDYPNDTHQLYGRGMSYSKILDPSLHRNDLDKTVTEDVINKRYDIIIYGSMHRGRPGWDIVNAYYDKSDIVVICGEDIYACGKYKRVQDSAKGTYFVGEELHNCEAEKLSAEGYTVFLREIFDKKQYLDVNDCVQS